jgi:hypothetical protein
MESRDKYMVGHLSRFSYNTYSSLKKATLILLLLDVPAFVMRLKDEKIIVRNYYMTGSSGKGKCIAVVFPKDKKE